VGRTQRFRYDAAGRVLQRTGYTGEVTEYQYDGTGRLVGENAPDFVQVSYHYDPAGRLLDRILSSGAQSRYQYDRDGRLTSLTNRAADGAEVTRAGYLRDATGHILQVTDGRGVTRCTYDPLYRLTGVHYPAGGSESYTYDKVGNRKTRTVDGITDIYSHDPANRLRTIQRNGAVTARFFYDLDGNLVRREDASGAPRLQLTWDARHLPVRVSVPGHVLTYRYDPLGQRIERSDNGVRLLELRDGEHLEARYRPSGHLVARYLRGVVVDEIVNGYRYHSLDPTDWTNLTFHHGPLETVRALTGPSGERLRTSVYRPFGELLSEQGGQQEPLRYTGRSLDPASGLYYYRARWYDPALGRFVSEDPLGFQAGINFYAYVGNDPVNGNDPTGLLVALQALSRDGLVARNATLVGSGTTLGGVGALTALGTGGAAAVGAYPGGAGALAAGRGALAGGRLLAPVLARALTSAEARGFAFSGSLGGISAGLGSLATGGTPRQAAIATGVGFAAGGVGSLRTVTGFGANIVKGGMFGLLGNLGSQGIDIGSDSSKTFSRDLNLGSAIGSTVGGGVGSGVTAFFGPSVLEKISAAIVKFPVSTTFGAIGKALGRPEPVARPASGTFFPSALNRSFSQNRPYFKP